MTDTTAMHVAILRAMKFGPCTGPAADASLDAAIAALAGQADAVPVACNHQPYHGACIHCDITFRNGVPVTTPPAIPVDALRELANEWRGRANDLRHAGLPMADSSPAIREAEKIDAFADELAALIATPPASIGAQTDLMALHDETMQLLRGETK